MLGLRPRRLRRASPTRSVDSLAPASSPVPGCGLSRSIPIGSILLRHGGVPPRRARVGDAQKCKNPTEINPVGFLVLATSYSRAAYRRTTIGAAAFHCRVRDGNGWGHCAIVTRVRNRTGSFAAVAATQARGRVSGDDVDLVIDDSPGGHRPPLHLQRTRFQIINLRSEIFNSPVL